LIIHVYIVNDYQQSVALCVRLIKDNTHELKA